MSWDNLSFASKFQVTCGVVVYSNLLTASIHQINASIYTLSLESIDADLTRDPSVEPPGLFSAYNSRVNTIRVHKIIYLPAPYFGIFLGGYLSPVEVWKQL